MRVRVTCCCLGGRADRNRGGQVTRQGGRGTGDCWVPRDGEEGQGFRDGGPRKVERGSARRHQNPVCPAQASLALTVHTQSASDSDSGAGTAGGGWRAPERPRSGRTVHQTLLAIRVGSILNQL